MERICIQRHVNNTENTKRKIPSSFMEDDEEGKSRH